ncbi:MAG: DUF6655 family protein [Phycisphaerales bacterium]
MFSQARTIPIALFAALALLPACTSTIRTTDPSRTATEQFLLSQAASLAVSQLSVEGLRGRRVFVDDQYFAASESKFVLGELRNRLFLGGVQLMPERDMAQVILEVRSGGVGIDRSDYLLGLPSLVLRAGKTAATPPPARPSPPPNSRCSRTSTRSASPPSRSSPTGPTPARSSPPPDRSSGAPPATTGGSSASARAPSATSRPPTRRPSKP